MTINYIIIVIYSIINLLILLLNTTGGKYGIWQITRKQHGAKPRYDGLNKTCSVHQMQENLHSSHGGYKSTIPDYQAWRLQATKAPNTENKGIKCAQQIKGRVHRGYNSRLPPAREAHSKLRKNKKVE